MIDDELFVSDVIDLVRYADSMAKILKEQGFPGKAEALEERCLQVFAHIALERDPETRDQTRAIKASLLNKLREEAKKDKMN